MCIVTRLLGAFCGKYEMPIHYIERFVCVLAKSAKKRILFMQNNDKKKISQAQIEASKRYHAKTYKRFSADIKIEDYNFIDEYCKNNNISKAKLCVNAIKYCIDNNIKLND